MRRGRNGHNNNNRALETVNAAATAIILAGSRPLSPPLQKRRWSNFWSGFWCFGFNKNRKQIKHAALVPEPTSPPGHVTTTSASTETRVQQQPAISFPFVAPPSSPASFLPSESPSDTQSPLGSIGMINHTSSANIYSPANPHSIFSIGPYAHETQLVTPPILSTYTTQPSTAPFTPPPESHSLHFTTPPSSPEVPFAQLLHRTPDVTSRFPSSQYEFHSYFLHPGSPVGPLISPRSLVSGSDTSSPLLGHEFPECSNVASTGSMAEFDFDNVSRVSPNDKPCVNANWWAWANEKVVS